MRVDVLTLFPSMFEGPLGTSILGRAQDEGLLEIYLWNIRDFAKDKHRIVDDTPYGGGAGMVLKPDVVVAGISHVKSVNPGPVIYLTPQGALFKQNQAKELVALNSFSLVCGHYEGLDERVRKGYIDAEISIGDYVLTGGELPAMVVIDTVARLIPGVLGQAESYETDSFYSGLLEHPHYTRPFNFEGEVVPEVLLSGHHEKIRHWRRKESLRRTVIRRPDLLEGRSLTLQEQKILQEINKEISVKGGS